MVFGNIDVNTWYYLTKKQHLFYTHTHTQGKEIFLNIFVTQLSKHFIYLFTLIRTLFVSLALTHTHTQVQQRTYRKTNYNTTK